MWLYYLIEEEEMAEGQISKKELMKLVITRVLIVVVSFLSRFFSYRRDL